MRLPLESDYSEDSYTNSQRPTIKKQQPCRSASLLVHLRDKEADNMTEPANKRTKLDMSGHSVEESDQTSNNQISSMSSSPAANVSSAADHQDTSSHASAHLATPDSDLPLDASRFARIPPSGSDDTVCARTNIVYIASKRKTGAAVSVAMATDPVFLNINIYNLCIPLLYRACL